MAPSGHTEEEQSDSLISYGVGMLSRLTVIAIAALVIVSGVGLGAITGVLVYNELNENDGAADATTKSPTLLPTLCPTSRPSLPPSPSPTAQTSIVVRDKEELVNLVLTYLATRRQGTATTPQLPIGDWDVSNIDDMEGVFEMHRVLQDLFSINCNEDISSWNVSRVTTMSIMFRQCGEFNQDLSKWDTSNVQDMAGMFEGAYGFNGDIGRWNTSKVTEASGMFLRAVSFNQDLSSWDVSKVTSMVEMFRSAISFNSDIGGWNVSSLSDTSGMFENTFQFDQDLSQWNTERVTSMSRMFACDPRYLAAMIFDYNESLAQNIYDQLYIEQKGTNFNGNIGRWNTNRVADMERMFEAATRFNQDISRFNVSLVSSTIGMFSNASSFNQNIAKWDMSNVRNMKEMFMGARNFDQVGLCDWNIKQVTSFKDMFERSAMENASYCSWIELANEKWGA